MVSKGSGRESTWVSGITVDHKEQNRKRERKGRITIATT